MDSVMKAGMEEISGIEMCIRDRFRPFLSTVQNNRDHRKILVIDGVTAFNGGVNLADEYINKDVYKRQPLYTAAFGTLLSARSRKPIVILPSVTAISMLQAFADICEPMPETLSV